MKILVTGGAGFIGSNVVDRFIEEGHDVVVVDNLSSGRLENINKKARFHNIDIRDENLREIFRQERPDVVDHHAAQIDVRKAVADPRYDAEVNILGTLNLIEACREFEVKKFIYISTGGAVYGDPDPDRLPADESTAVNPLSPYGITKHTVEHYLFTYRANFGMNYTVLRYPNVYGPRQDPHGEAGVVAIFSLQMLTGVQPMIFGDGSKTRDYLYVGDVVEANRIALEKGDGEIFNLGWGKEISDFQIFDAVRTALGVDVEPKYADFRPGEVERISLDAAKAKAGLGWEPKVPLEEGARLATEYYKQRVAAEADPKSLL